MVQADAYGLGAGPVGRALCAAGARSFFVALAGEGAALREAIGARQGVDALAARAGAIGYEILTSLGPSCERVYLGAP